jgi:hypothetical protein
MTGKPRKITWTPEAIRALGVRTDVPTAGDIIAGWCKTEAYNAVKRGDFPVPVIKVGRRLVVPVASILALFRIDLQDAAPEAVDRRVSRLERVSSAGEVAA